MESPVLIDKDGYYYLSDCGYSGNINDILEINGYKYKIIQLRGDGLRLQPISFQWQCQRCGAMLTERDEHCPCEYAVAGG